MKNSIIYILLTISLVASLFSLALVVFSFQSRSSSSANQTYSASPVETAGPSATDETGNKESAPKRAPFNQAEELKKNLKTSFNSFGGEIKQIKPGVLTVETMIPDLSQLSKLDYSQSSVIPTINKTYTVIVDSRTVFIQGKMSDLKIDDVISVTSREPILEKSEFIAATIIKS